MMINNNKVKSDEVTFNVYKRNGCSYIKARQWVTLIDGTLARIPMKLIWSSYSHTL